MTAAVYWFICSREAYSTALPTVTANQGDFNRKVTNAIGGIRKSRHGIGDLLARPNGKSVTDHLLCDGSAISRVSFPQLFTELGTEWGAGDGVTTFNLPNLTTAALPLPATVPTQTIGDGGTVSTGGTVTTPTEPSQSGGTSGGNVPTGGRPPSYKKFGNYVDDPLPPVLGS